MTKQTFVLRPDSAQPFQSLLEYLTQRDKSIAWQVDVKPYKKDRTQEQNRYYWGVVLVTIQKAIEDSRGEHYSTEEIHEWMRDKFLTKRVVTIKGEPKVLAPSTTKLTVGEFAEYLEQIIRFCAESGILIPDAEAA